MDVKKRVLVVDDEPGVLRFVQVALEMAGYDVITTTSGEEALKLAESEHPDVMLLDILMVPVTGFEVLDRLRVFSELLVIVFTARSFIAEKAIALGANGFISKPFQPEELVKKVEEVLGAGKAGA